MSAERYIKFTGEILLNTEATQESSGTSNSGDIVCLSSSGKIDGSMLLNLDSITISASGNHILDETSPTVVRIHNESSTQDIMSITLPAASTCVDRVHILVRDSASGSAVPIRTSGDYIDGTYNPFNLSYANDSITVQAQDDGWLILSRKFGNIPNNYFIGGAASGQRTEPEARAISVSDLPGGSSAYAPVDASYLTLTSDSILTDERVFSVGSGLISRDGGAGSTYVVERDDSKIEWFWQKNPATGVLSVATVGTSLAPTLNGTETVYSDSTGTYLNHASATTVNALAGWTNGTFTHTQTRFNPTLTCTIKTPVSGDAATEFHIGWGGYLPHIAGTASLLAFRHNTLDSGNWKLEIGADGGLRPPSYTDTGIAFAYDTRYVFKIVVAGNGTVAYFYINNVLVATYSDTTYLPTTTSGLQAFCYAANLGAGLSSGIRIARVHCRQ
jgi:hypothetical protein